jgi:hypothetical protein
MSPKREFEPKRLMEEGKMKAYTVGIAAAALLLVVTGMGFGIAQAGGAHSERPVLSTADMDALEQDSSSSAYVEHRPILSFEDMKGPIETGAIPATLSEESRSVD